jgi:hypothetical protein
MVRVVEPAAEPLTIVDVLLGALGLTGVLLLIAILCGALLGGAMIAIRRLRDRNAPAEPPPAPLRIT